MQMTRDEALAEMRRASSRRTICEVHREIYDACDAVADPLVKETIQDLVLEAFIMGKKIDNKLREYRADWDEGFYQTNADRRDDRHKRRE